MIDDLKDCIVWLNTNNFKKVCVQITDNLLIYSSDIVQQLQKNSNASVYVIGNTKYESCCVDKISVDYIQADSFIHIGHTCLSYNDNLPIYHIFPKEYFNFEEFFEKFYCYFKDHSQQISMFYDVSYASIIESVVHILKQKYTNFIASSLNCTSDFTAKQKFQSNFSILNRFSNLPNINDLNDYDGIYLGMNNKVLHTLALSTPIKQWHYFEKTNFFKFEISLSSWLRKRNFLKEKIKDAYTFGLIIATLNIQEYLKITIMLKKMLENVNKKVYIFNVGKINPSKLANFQEIDVFVLISCPESSIIETRDYLKPVVTPFDIELSFNSIRNSLLPYAIDYKDMLPNGIYFKQFEPPSKSDVSLTSGKIRYSNQSNNSKYKINKLDENEAKIIYKTNQSLLSANKWNGLQISPENTSVNVAVHGRDGLPTKYFNETCSNKK